MRSLLLLSCFIALLFLSGCQEETPQAIKIPPQSTQSGGSDVAPATPAPEEGSRPAVLAGEDQSGLMPPEEMPEPPRPPVFEDFQGAPQLTLFPRVGDFRPEDDSDRLPYWNTFIEHLVKTTGVVEEQSSGNRAWAFRSINSIDSVGYFSPLSVAPQTTYQVSFNLVTELVEEASAGVGVLEFNEFLWIPHQYTEETTRQHFRNSHEDGRVTGTSKGEHNFRFTTGPETEMIHLILFREGPHDRNGVKFDDIRIEQVDDKRE